IDKLQSTFHQWERIPSDIGEQLHLTKELLASCESIEWQVDELDKAIAVAARDPSWYSIDEVELEKRRRWTSTARMQVGTMKKAVEAGKESNGTGTTGLSGMRHNDDFIASESDRQLLLIKQQDEELDELSASVERIGGVGLTIHEELLAQEKIIDELGMEMDSTSNRLDFVQKKVAMVMKKAGAKGQIMMILQQDEELDELSASVERIGGVGLTIHEELLAQEKIIDELGMEMDSTSNRLDFVQKKM
ncbi:syntaxin-61, partial [Quercus suber]